jgi:trk system potassium uptake protein TrkA
VKIIIVGAGEVGFHIAEWLSQKEQDVVVIDKDPEKIKRIHENLDVQALLGSGTSPKLLKESGIRTADMMVAATDSDEVNLISCLLARNLNPSLLKVARVRNEEYVEDEELFSKALLDVDHIINPESLMSQTILSLMKVPGASEVIDFADGKVKLIGLTIPETSPFVDTKLKSFGELKDRPLVGAIVRGDQVLIPRGDDTIRAYDLVYVVAREDEVNHVLSRLNIKKEKPRRAVIVGAGRIGTALTAALEAGKIGVKIIEKDDDKCSALAAELHRTIVIRGDGTDRNLLQEETVGEADFLIAVTDDDESNILISLLGKGLGAKRTITRVSKFSYIHLLPAIGIDTVVSSRLSAIRAILQYIRRGRIISVAPLKGEHAEAIEVEALETSAIVNIPLAEVDFPKGVIVGAIVRGKEVIIPCGDSVIRPGDHLIIFAAQNVVPKLERLLTVKLEYF